MKIFGVIHIIVLLVCVFQPFSGDQMEDFSSELFNSFFDDHLLERPLLTDRPSPLHIDMDSNPGEFSAVKNMHAALSEVRPKSTSKTKSVLNVADKPTNCWFKNQQSDS
ncbi:hypothetical protein ILYODFUR_038034 [Ilyodon furcidens]|uniref:Uncharacterized protein n=1 Tax=Ilyodon furcidens TaxID=33524 RepID=A0ABV0TFY3_9TELE